MWHKRHLGDKEKMIALQIYQALHRHTIGNKWGEEKKERGREETERWWELEKENEGETGEVAKKERN